MRQFNPVGDVVHDATVANRGVGGDPYDADRELEVPAATRQPTGQGFSFIGYDLADLNVPFEPRALRLQGSGTTTAGDALELWVVKARIDSCV